MLRLVSTVAAVAIAASMAGARAQISQEPPQAVPDLYPAGYSGVIEAAKTEAKVVVYATTDTTAAGPLLKDFQALYPGITIEYSNLNAAALYGRFAAEFAAGPTADVLWSATMDRQVKLAADGQAATYESPEV